MSGYVSQPLNASEKPEERLDQDGAQAWTSEEIYTVARSLFLVGERPSEPKGKTLHLTDGILHHLSERLPHRTPDDILDDLFENYVPLCRAYTDCTKQIVEQGFDVLRPYTTGNFEELLEIWLDSGLMELAEEWQERIKDGQ